MASFFFNIIRALVKEKKLMKYMKPTIYIFERKMLYC